MKKLVLIPLLFLAGGLGLMGLILALIILPLVLFLLTIEIAIPSMSTTFTRHLVRHPFTMLLPSKNDDQRVSHFRPRAGRDHG